MFEFDLSELYDENIFQFERVTNQNIIELGNNIKKIGDFGALIRKSFMKSLTSIMLHCFNR